VGTKSNAATFVLASVRKNGDTRSFDSSCVAMCVCVCVCACACVLARTFNSLPALLGFPRRGGKVAKSVCDKVLCRCRRKREEP